MTQRIRIKDIAQLAGVSKGTVDRVLHKRGNVSPDALMKVREAMEQLHYEPNVIASALASKKGWRIAVLLPDFQYDPFWVQPKQGIERATNSVRDYGVLIDYFFFRDAEPEHFTLLGQKILEGGYDALLLSPSFQKEGNEFLAACEESEIPYIQINTYLERSHPCFLAYIGQDSYSSGVLAAKLLNFEMSPGDKAVILHLEKEVYNAKHLMDKQKGFEDYFKAHADKGIQMLEKAYGDIHNKKGLDIFVQEMLREHPNVTGIFVSTSKLFHVVPFISKHSKREIGLIGFDLIEENLKYLETEEIHFLINQNPYKQGFLGIMNLFNHLVLKKQIKHIQLLPLDMVMRENVQYYVEEEDAKLHIII